MENLSAYRYCIAMKKGRKIFIIIAGCTMILISSIFIILTVIFYVLEQEFGFYTFLGTLLIPLIFFIFGILGIVAATKRVEIYKGKVVYHIGFTNKEYRMSDIRASKTQIETYNTGLYLEDIVPVYSYDKVTVFYDEKGKKIFEFGLDYDNVERLKADVKNTQKSILKHHSKNISKMQGAFMEYRCIGLDIWRVLTSPIPRSWEVTQLCRCFFGQGDESP